MRMRADYAVLCLATVTIFGTLIYAANVEAVVTTHYAQSLAR